VTHDPSRRRLLAGGLAGLGSLALAGCDRLTGNSSVNRVLDTAEGLTRRAQRLAVGGSLAREYTLADLSPVFRVNGTAQPDDEDYVAMQANGFVDWRLKVDGLVQRPLSLSLAELRRLPARTQITRHDCVEGWSGIAQWTGVPLGLVLRAAGLQTKARYAVFHCFDELEQTFDGSGRFYGSIDLIDAFHPQTILAYAMNGRPLEVGHGAPLRLRVERQLGYKQSKYIQRIELVESFAHLGAGKGGYWEDRGYEWYAGI
jgi:DMSO/TMAO reductase YedYZ molybdopterin-dependent catalytic subunit